MKANSFCHEDNKLVPDKQLRKDPKLKRVLKVLYHTELLQRRKSKLTEVSSSKHCLKMVQSDSIKQHLSITANFVYKVKNSLTGKQNIKRPLATIFWSVSSDSVLGTNKNVFSNPALKNGH
ncbi:hypothetical protein NPIL_214811 [Nephila pilipes]|uniref:Uncharacterized protein n=1 Tax=Nephila pilipes TaxID=299642 RepID=A0A8X6TCI6_NEPPI|nr:hypothetical protein NPIL_214811 [Nephila pilipes]